MAHFFYKKNFEIVETIYLQYRTKDFKNNLYINLFFHPFKYNVNTIFQSIKYFINKI